MYFQRRSITSWISSLVNRVHCIADEAKRKYYAKASFVLKYIQDKSSLTTVALCRISIVYIGSYSSPQASTAALF